MPFLGTIVNFLVVLVCGLIGLLIKKSILKRFFESVKIAMAICVIYIGIDGAVSKATIGYMSVGDRLLSHLSVLICPALLGLRA